jgi:hypothetical protein
MIKSLSGKSLIKKVNPKLTRFYKVSIKFQMVESQHNRLLYQMILSLFYVRESTSSEMTSKLSKSIAGTSTKRD